VHQACAPNVGKGGEEGRAGEGALYLQSKQGGREHLDPVEVSDEDEIKGPGADDENGNKEEQAYLVYEVWRCHEKIRNFN